MSGSEPDEATPTGQDTVVVRLTRRELSLLSNAIGESLEAVEDWEYETRLGETRDSARRVRATLKAALADGRGQQGVGRSSAPRRT